MSEFKTSLPIGGVVDVNISVMPGGLAVDVGCNKGMIITENDFVDEDERVRAYRSLKDVLDDFDSESDEYKAAGAYFSQSPKPKLLYFGMMPESGETIGETVTACMEKAPDVYGVYMLGASDAEAIQAVTALDALDKGVLFFDTKNADALLEAPGAPDAFTAMKTAKAERAIGIYSLDDFAGAALMGMAMGRETGLDNSAFTVNFGVIRGIETENVTEAEFGILMGKDGNIHIRRGQGYEMVQSGRRVDGVPYDDAMYLDMTQKLVENEVMKVMYGNKAKRPQTDAGMAVIVSAITNALERVRRIGYISEGVWTGDEFRDLMPGDVVTGGYMIFPDSFNDQDPAERAQRKAPPIWVALKTAGTIESVVIGINVNI